MVPFDEFRPHWRAASHNPVSEEASVVWILLDKNVFDLRWVWVSFLQKEMAKKSRGLHVQIRSW